MKPVKEKTGFEICLDNLFKEYMKCQQCGKDTLPLTIQSGKRLCPICAYQLKYSFYHLPTKGMK